MKKNNKKIALALLSTATIMALAISSTNAMYGQGQGQGRGLGQKITAEERAKLQSMTPEERQTYAQELKAKYGVSNGQGRGQGGQGQAKQSGHNEDPSQMIAGVTKQDVSETEKEFLINQYGEEKMARDLYAYAAEKYPNVNTFSNITKSEQQHMDAIKTLLDRYNISAPSDYAKDNDLYVTLKEKIDKSEKDAIEVGITVEMVDIDDIAADIKATDNDDIKIVLTNIGGASYNHLRGFVNALQNAGYTTDLKWTDYITEEEANSKGGGLKVKLAEKLEAEGVSLPEKASSKYIKDNCNNDGQGHGQGQGKGYGKGRGQGNNQGRGQGQRFGNGQATTTSQTNGIDVTLKNKYKDLIKTKYSSVIDNMSEEKLKAVLDKINAFQDKIRTSFQYSLETKRRYGAILVALKEVVEEKLGLESNFIDDMLQ